MLRIVLLLAGLGLGALPATGRADAIASTLSAEAPAPSPVTPAGTATSDKLRLLLDLAADPEVRAIVERHGASPAGAVQAGPAPMGHSMAGGLGDDLQNLRTRIRALGEAVPRLPDQLARAQGLLTDMLGRGDAVSLLLFLPAFVALGFGGEWLFKRGTRRVQHWLLALRLETVKERVSAVFARLAFGLGIVASYAIGSLGAVLPFDWTPRLKQVLLGLLLASLITRLVSVFGRFLLAPGAPRFRVVPIGTAAASFLFHRIVVLGLLLGVGSQLIVLLAALGFDLISQELCVDALGLMVLGALIETVWHYPVGTPTELADGLMPSATPEAASRELSAREPSRVMAPGVPATEPAATFHPDPAVRSAAHAERHHLRAGGIRLALSVGVVLLWCLWVAGVTTAFWLLLFVPGLPAAVVLTQRSIRHVLRPTDHEFASAANRLEVIFLERGIRTLMIAGGAALLGHLIGLDVAALTMQDTIATRAGRAVLGVLVVLLAADFLWHVIVALIDRKLAVTMAIGDGSDTAGHAARLQTLLPILKNLSLAVLSVVAGMMVLAALGVEIGPLIASAGVVGVAIGFGAQTLVKDIISGIFYLIDDAFRIGEYIQSGTYKGTVESFSLRSVKLRHQRGALYTIPFGTLGAVQNLSRDWVVDKIVLNVPYDTDLDRVRKIIKRIGEALAADEEFGADILKPIKLQGVAQFGDFAIQLQTKMMTKPGDVQFAARRRALLLIKQEFQANGIGFALPTVQVSGEGSEGAAAQRALSLVKAATAGAAE